MKNWQGNWIIGVSMIHTIYALIKFSTDYISLYDNGIINSITTDHVYGAVWFFLFGQVLFIVGLLLKHFDSLNNRLVPLSVLLNLLLLTVMGIIIMPVSGIWLMFPPVISLLIKHRKNLNQTVAV